MLKLAGFAVCLALFICMNVPHVQSQGGTGTGTGDHHHRNHTFNGLNGTFYCNMMAQEDCWSYTFHMKCGTNRVTYQNNCFLGQAHCLDGTINQAHSGVCVDGLTTTMSPEQIIHGSQIVLDLQCMAMSHKNCTVITDEKICGTNGVTYIDFCEYEKARCTYRDLHAAKLGAC